jgi:hypothetical protein
MKNDQKISDEVKKTISLLDNIKKIEPNPFLFTRIKEGIDSANNKKSVSSIDFAFTLFKQIVFAALFLLNIYSVISYLSNGRVNGQYRTQYIKNVVSEYSIKTESDYLTNYVSKD